MEYAADLAIGLVGLGLIALGVAFKGWTNTVERGSQSLERLEKSIREIVELRLDAAIKDWDRISLDIHEIRLDLKNWNKSHADLVARLAVLETVARRFTRDQRTND